MQTSTPPLAALSHYSNVIKSAMASQITGVPIVTSTVCSCSDQRKHQSSASLAFFRGIHRSPANSTQKGPVTRKCFHLMTSPWISSVSFDRQLTDCDPMTPSGATVFCWASRHKLNYCWCVVHLGTNFNRNSNIFVRESALENVVCETAAILSWCQYITIF